MLVPEDDFDAMITATEAADEFGVHDSTIHSWVRKGYLAKSGLDVRCGRLCPVYRRGDVALAEQRTRPRRMRCVGSLRVA